MKLILFSKMFHEHSWEELARYANDLGFYGIDLTCRPGGHILPENAAHDLSRAIEHFASQGLKVPMLTTAFTSANDAHAETVFKIASECGIKYIKLGYWVVKSFGEVSCKYEQMTGDLDGLEALAKQHEICALIHTHSENVLNSNAALIANQLKCRDNRYIGAYIDPAHLAVSGGTYGWSMAVDWLAPYIKMVAVKNMIWTSKKKGSYNEWEAKIAPLKQGVAPWPKVMELLNKIEYDGYFSVFGEYWEPISFKVMNVQEMIEQVRDDITYLKELWDKR